MKNAKRLLIVDDEAHIRRVLQVAFEKDKLKVATAEDVPSALAQLESAEFHCVITDVTMPGRTGYELLDEIQARTPHTPVIIMTAFGTIPHAVRAMRNGAFEYLTKPVDLHTLKKVVQSAIESYGSVSASSGPKSGPTNFQFIAESPAMKEVVALVRQVADSKATVLITGESGAGKEIVAKSLHHFSQRSKSPFVAVSCAALPETLLESELFGFEKGAFTGAMQAKTGRFEAAETGTLFLDEIGEIPLATQVKLLRVLQEREFERLGSTKPTKVDVRLVTATNRNLAQAVDAGTFRLDLMYRLQVIEINVPPLRERVEDIVPLAQHFLAKYCNENRRDPLALSAEAVDSLCAYRWPGNVRELENTIERAVVIASPSANEIEPSHLPRSLNMAA